MHKIMDCTHCTYIHSENNILTGWLTSYQIQLLTITIEAAEMIFSAKMQNWLGHYSFCYNFSVCYFSAYLLVTFPEAFPGHKATPIDF